MKLSIVCLDIEMFFGLKGAITEGLHVIYSLHGFDESMAHLGEYINEKSPKKSSLLKLIWQDESQLDSLSPRQFEELICELLIEKGFKPEITPQTRDGGKDIIIRHDVLGEALIYIECKKYSPEKPVGSEAIQKLVGAMALDYATKAVIYTTSFFSQAAKKLAAKIKYRLKLFDRIDLLEQIKNVMHKTRCSCVHRAI